jgi:hypothetical protein
MSPNQTVNVADDDLVWMVNSKQNAQGSGLERFSLEIMTQVGQGGSSASISSGSRQYNIDRAALP